MITGGGPGEKRGGPHWRRHRWRTSPIPSDERFRAFRRPDPLGSAARFAACPARFAAAAGARGGRQHWRCRPLRSRSARQTRSPAPAHALGEIIPGLAGGWISPIATHMRAVGDKVLQGGRRRVSLKNGSERPSRAPFWLARPQGAAGGKNPPVAGAWPRLISAKSPTTFEMGPPSRTAFGWGLLLPRPAGDIRCACRVYKCPIQQARAAHGQASDPTAGCETSNARSDLGSRAAARRKTSFAREPGAGLLHLFEPCCITTGWKNRWCIVLPTVLDHAALSGEPDSARRSTRRCATTPISANAFRRRPCLPSTDRDPPRTPLALQSTPCSTSRVFTRCRPIDWRTGSIKRPARISPIICRAARRRCFQTDINPRRHHPAAASSSITPHRISSAARTAVIEDDVSILHGVTLGGTGKENEDRHPKIRHGCDDRGRREDSRQYRGRPIARRIAAGSVVVKPVPHNVTRRRAVPAKKSSGEAGCGPSRRAP